MKRLFASLAIIFSLLLTPLGVMAQSSAPAIDADSQRAILDQLISSGGKTELQNNPNPQESIAQIIQLGLGFVGTFFLILVLVGGYNIYVSRGDDARYQKGKDIIRMASIGLAIVLVSYSITLLVGRLVQDAAIGDAPNPPGYNPNASGFDDFANIFEDTSPNVE